MELQEFRDLYNNGNPGSTTFTCARCGVEYTRDTYEAWRSNERLGKIICSKCSRVEGRMKQSETMRATGSNIEAKRKRAISIGEDGHRDIIKKRAITLGPEGMREVHRKQLETMGPEGIRRSAKRRLETFDHDRRIEALVKARHTKFPSSSFEYPEWFISSLASDCDRELASKGKLHSSDTLEFICPCCGSEFKRKVYNVIIQSTMQPKLPLHSGDELWCSNCSNTSHTGITEQKVFDTLSKVYSITKESNFFPKIDGSRGCYEGDIVCKEDKWVIEIDGEYYHTEGPSGFHEYGYHHDKDLAIEAKGYRVLHVNTEWIDQDFNMAIKLMTNWIESGLPTIHSQFDTVNNQ